MAATSYGRPCREHESGRHGREQHQDDGLEGAGLDEPHPIAGSDSRSKRREGGGQPLRRS